MGRIGILGAGSAGILAASHFNANLGSEWEITTVHSNSIPILGIGESTNPSFLTTLELGTGFSHIEDLEKLGGTIKLGTRYTDWREQEFTNPLIGGTLAVHIDTYSLQNFALPRMKEKWDKYTIEVGLIVDVLDKGELVEVHIEGRDSPLNFDYVIDCRGFPKKGSPDIEWIKNPLLDSCIVYDLKIANDLRNTFSTGHIATSHGWMFEVPLGSRTSYGYLFNSKHTSEEEAILGLSSTIKVPLTEKNTKKFSFVPYYRKKVLNGRILYSGNSAVFFEPMFANSLWLYDNINRDFIDYLEGRTTAEEFNKECVHRATTVYHTIALHYLGGSSKYDTSFWKDAKASALEILRTDSGVSYQQQLREGMKSVHNGYRDISTPVFHPHSWGTILNNLEYNIRSNSGTNI